MVQKRSGYPNPTPFHWNQTVFFSEMLVRCLTDQRVFLPSLEMTFRDKNEPRAWREGSAAKSILALSEDPDPIPSTFMFAPVPEDSMLSQ